MRVIFVFLCCFAVGSLANPASSSYLVYAKYLVFENISPLDERDAVEDFYSFCGDYLVVPEYFSQNKYIRFGEFADESIEGKFDEFNVASEKIEESDGYRVIGAFQWQQLVHSPQVDNRIPLSSGESISTDLIGDSRDSSCELSYQEQSFSQLNGFVEIVISRFIHVFSDFQLTIAGESGLENYKIQEQKKVSSKKMYYLDHPRFGVLFKVVSSKIKR